jgi:hypothetical protein
MKRILFFAATIAAPVMAQNDGRFPFVMPWDDATKTATDVSFLNPAPLTDKHRISVRDGRFFDGTGRRVRFMGTGTSAGANFPKKEDAPKIAARLRKLGFNIIRLHHMDAIWSRPNIFEGDPKRATVNPEVLDRLDYFVYCLKQNGIYVDLNLHVSWGPTAAGGWPDADKIPEMGKQTSYFETKSIEHQKSYARQFLTHVNPYTKMKWADDPAVALVEITNEDTIFGEAFTGKFANWPPYYRDQLQGRWNEFLKKKYPSTEALLQAWSSPGGLGPNILQNAQFAEGEKGWTFEKQAGEYSWKFAEAEGGPQGRALQISIAEKPDQSWKQQFHQNALDFEDGATYTIEFWGKSDKNRSLPLYLGYAKAPWRHIGEGGSVALTPQWKKYSVVVSVSEPLPKENRMSFVLGDATGDIWLADFSLRKGYQVTMEPGQTLEAGTIPLGNGANTVQGRDWIEFMLGIERDYSLMMKDYIQKELGAKQPVTCSQAWLGGLGGVLRESRMDWVDMHAYWQHPDFPNKPWDMNDWRIKNISMVREAGGGTIPGLAYHRVEGKPFTVTEYNHPAPNEYASETMPLIAAYAAWQDWDGVFLFDYHGGVEGWDSNKITGFFASAVDPNKMASMAAASLIFLGNKLPPSPRKSTLVVPRGSVVQTMARNPVSQFWDSNLSRLWQQNGGTRRDWLENKIAVRLVDGSGPLRLEREFPPAQNANSAPVFDWRTDTPESALVTVKSPTAKAVVGFLGGQWVDLGGFVVQMEKTPRNFVTLALTPRDNFSVGLSRSMLLTAMSNLENTGMEWNEERTSVGTKWGSGPTMAEGIAAQIMLETDAHRAEVWALDARGKRTMKIPSQLKNRRLNFRIAPEYKALCYEIAATFAVVTGPVKPVTLPVAKPPVKAPVGVAKPPVKVPVKKP